MRSQEDDVAIHFIEKLIAQTKALFIVEAACDFKLALSCRAKTNFHAC